MTKTTKTEAVLWSIALPGFGQILNGHLVKGLVFIFLEILINVKSNFNLGIIESFQGNIQGAGQVMNLQWLLFYPCIYMFAVYDAYKFGQGPSRKLIFIPFAFGAYFVTLGLIFASKAVFFGVQPGPVFFPMLMLLPGFALGFLILKITVWFMNRRKSR